MLVAAAASTVLAVGCAEAREIADETVPTTSGGDSALLARRLGAVSTADVAMGESFNLDMLRLGFRTVGFTDEESRCSAEVIAAARGAEFASLTVSALFAADSLTAEVLLPCLSPERLQEVGTGAVVGEVPEDAAAEFRQLTAGLAAAGYEAAGLTSKEASCVAGAAKTDDAPSPGDMTGSVPTAVITSEIVEQCVSADRIVQLVS